MSFPDILPAVVARLQAALDVPVAARVPDSRPEVWVQVRRVGGTALPPVRDQARLDVIAWAPTDASAMATLLAARESLWGLAGRPLDGQAVYQITEFMGPRLQDDPSYGVPTAWMTLELTVRADSAIHLAP